MQLLSHKLYQHDNDLCMGRWILLIPPLINPLACLSPSVCQRRMRSGSRSIQGQVEGTRCSWRGFIRAAFARWHCITNAVHKPDDLISPPLSHWQLPSEPRLGKKKENIESPRGGPFPPRSGVTIQIEEGTNKKAYICNASWEIPQA